jgi:hypothetical protein
MCSTSRRKSSNIAHSCSNVHDVHVLDCYRSLYVLQGEARYTYTHEIEPAGHSDSSSESSSVIQWNGQQYNRGRRISLIFRDAFTAPGT